MEHTQSKTSVAAAMDESIPEASAPLSFQARSVTSVLRWLGAVTLMAAGGSYLVSNWMEASPLTRFSVFLGFTAFLAVAGLFCGLRWREEKGARTFLALAVLFIPVCSAQVAWFLYTQLERPAAPGGLFRIEPVGQTALILAGVAWASIALPTIFLAFLVLARPEAKRLAMAYLTGNLVLLLPERDPDAVLLVAAGLLGFLLLLERRFFARAAMLRHRDGMAMRLAMFLPLVILLGRNLMLFGSSPNLIGFMLLSCGGFLFLGLPEGLSAGWLKAFARLTGFGVMATGWWILAVSLSECSGVPWPETVVPVCLLPVAGMALLLSFHAGGDGRVYRRLAGGGAMAALLFQLISFGGMASIWISLGVSVALVAGAFWVTDRTMLISGTLGFVFTLAYVFFSVREFWAQNLWISLGSSGVAILVASSLMERNWHRLHQGTAAIRTRWRDWE